MIQKSLVLLGNASNYVSETRQDLIMGKLSKKNRSLGRVLKSACKNNKRKGALLFGPAVHNQRGWILRQPSTKQRGRPKVGNQMESFSREPDFQRWREVSQAVPPFLSENLCAPRTPISEAPRVPPIPTNKETLQEGTPAVPQSSTILQPPAVIPPPNTNPSSSNISHSNIPISHLPPETPPCGGCLQFFIGAWSRITQDPWVLQVVCGYQLDFSSHPPLRRPRHTQPALARDQTQVIEAQIQSLLEKQAIVRLTPPLSPVFYSSVFVVPKKDRGWRPIINLRELNRYVISPHFKMENISNLKDVILPGDWMCKIDLKDTYPLHRSDSRFLRFSWEEDYYQFKTLPFGLTSALCLPNSSAQLLHCSGRLV